MKYLMFILFLFISCENPERCGVCQSTIYFNGSPESELVNDKRLVCGEELECLNGRVVRMEDSKEYTSISITRCK